MKKLLLMIVILIFTLTFTSCTNVTADKVKENEEDITICAAASLTDALNEIKPKFEEEKGIKLTLNFASSGTLKKQIEQGAPADVFISASKKYMDQLEATDLIDENSRKDLLKNKLVLIVSNEYQDKIKNISDLSNMDMKISIGEPESVPAGRYAKESLIYLGLWEQLKDTFIYAKNVKQVVKYVETGDVDAGIVYNSDATLLKSSVVVQMLEEESHKPIVYPVAIISSSKKKEAGEKLLDYFTNSEVKEIFEKYGFDLYEK